MYRVLKIGGRLLVLEFSTPIFEPIIRVYHCYLFSVLPIMGKIVAHDARSYRYLAESIIMHPNQETLKLIMLESGFNHVEYFNITGGIVALHRGYKL